MHKDWSAWKKIRNGAGWWLCLPGLLHRLARGALALYNWGKVKHRFYLSFFEKRYGLKKGLVEEMLEGLQRLGRLPVKMTEPSSLRPSSPSGE